jgi:hypothetical protein
MRELFFAHVQTPWPSKGYFFDHDPKLTNKFLACFVEKGEDSKLIHIFYPKIMEN